MDSPPKKRARHSNNVFDLKVITGPSENVCQGKLVDIQIWLCTAGSTKIEHSHDLDLSVSLLYEDGTPVGNVHIGTSPHRLSIHEGKCLCELSMNTLSMLHGNQRFKLRFEAKNLGMNPSDQITVHPCMSKPFFLVKYRLVITREPEEKFYKDQGGRSKCLSVHLQLVNLTDRAVTDQRVPLNCHLVYGNGQVCPSQQQLLDVITEDPKIDGGETEIRFRILQVSKNHNKRKFRLMIEPSSDDPNLQEISSTRTRGVAVFSKRTKPKTKTTSEHNGMTAVMPPYLEENNNQNNNGPLPWKIESNHQGAPMLPNGLPPVLPMPMPITNGMDNNGRSPQPLGGTDLSSDGVVPRLVEYCHETYSLLKSIEWQMTGYETDRQTGLVDKNRPLFRCPVCNQYRTVAFGEHLHDCRLSHSLSSFRHSIAPLSKEFIRPDGGEMQALDEEHSSPHHMSSPPRMSMSMNERHGMDMDVDHDTEQREFEVNEILKSEKKPNRIGLLKQRDVVEYMPGGFCLEPVISNPLTPRSRALPMPEAIKNVPPIMNNSGLDVPPPLDCDIFGTVEMERVNSISKEKTKYGFPALGANNELIGFVDPNGFMSWDDVGLAPNEQAHFNETYSSFLETDPSQFLMRGNNGDFDGNGIASLFDGNSPFQNG